MVLTKSELIASLQHEVRILLHLASKIDRAALDYRPTPKQRSTIELLKYLTVMGPELVKVAKVGAFDPAVWTVAEKAAAARDFDQTLAAIAAQTDVYASLLGGMSDADFRADVEIFGDKIHSRRLHCQPRAVRVRGLPDAVVPVPQGLRPRGVEHDQPLGRGRSAAASLAVSAQRPAHDLDHRRQLEGFPQDGGG